MTIPTYLTIARLLAAGLIPLLLVLLDGSLAFWIIAALFLGSSLTDWLDGYLARRLGQETQLGRMLDPIADKILVSCALLVVIVGLDDRIWLVLPASVILARELFVSGLREFVGNGNATLKVSALAKWKTAVQMLALLGLMVCCALEIESGRMPVISGILGLWLAAVLTAVSGVDYFRKALPIMQKESGDG